jgi:hydrogenase/urease accessory protein HupE
LISLIMLVFIARLIRDVPEIRAMAADPSRRVRLALLSGASILGGLAAGAVMPPSAHNPTGKLLIIGVLIACAALLLVGSWLAQAASHRHKPISMFLIVAAGSFSPGFEVGRCVAA